MTRRRGAGATPARPRAPPGSGNARAASAARALSATGPAAGERRPLPLPRARPPRSPGPPPIPPPDCWGPSVRVPSAPASRRAGGVRAARARARPREPDYKSQGAGRGGARGTHAGSAAQSESLSRPGRRRLCGLEPASPGGRAEKPVRAGSLEHAESPGRP